MATADAFSGVYERLGRLMDDGSLPPRAQLPRYLAPIPHWLENIALHLVWLLVLINLAGTAFGFWYYRFQFIETPIVMWPFVPDSPLATFFIACSLCLFALGRSNELVNALAVFGCIKLGLWTPYVLLAFFPAWGYLHPAMYNFLFWSHLLMAVQAFGVHRYADFPRWAVGVALLWYTVDLIVDYFYPIVGNPHHTALPLPDPQLWFGMTVLQVAAIGAIVLTVIPPLLMLAIRRKNSYSDV